MNKVYLLLSNIKQVSLNRLSLLKVVAVLIFPYSTRLHGPRACVEMGRTNKKSKHISIICSKWLTLAKRLECH